MAGYTDGFNKINGEVIEAPTFEQEFSQLDAAFEGGDNSTGHNHSVAGEGGYIPFISSGGGKKRVEIDGPGNKIIFSLNSGGFKVSQVEILDGSFIPTLSADIDLGAVGNTFKDIHADGVANLATLSLATGSNVTAIHDEDDMFSDSAAGLATQQSIKAYVDSSVTSGHTHDGVSGSIVNFIASNDEFNVLEIDDVNNRMVFSTDVASVKTNKLYVDGSGMLPFADNSFILGGPSNRFSVAWAQTVRADNLQFALGVAVTSVLDEDDLVSDSATALVTQQSVKAHIATEIAAGVLAHTHDGISSPTLDKIQSPDGFNRVTINDGLNRIVFQVDVASVATSKVAIDVNSIYPATDIDVDLGRVAQRFTNGYFDTVHATVGKIVRQAVPPTVTGQAGDLAGMIASNATHVYTCHTDYDGVTSIWVRAVLAAW